jgi:hypothetical protein
MADNSWDSILLDHPEWRQSGWNAAPMYSSGMSDDPSAQSITGYGAYRPDSGMNSYDVNGNLTNSMSPEEVARRRAAGGGMSGSLAGLAGLALGGMGLSGMFGGAGAAGTVAGDAFMPGMLDAGGSVAGDAFMPGNLASFGANPAATASATAASEIGAGASSLGGFTPSAAGWESANPNFSTGNFNFSPSLSSGTPGYDIPTQNFAGDASSSNLNSAFQSSPESLGVSSEYTPAQGAADYANGGPSNGVYGKQSLGNMFDSAKSFLTSPIAGNKFGLTPMQGLGSLYDMMSKKKTGSAQMDRYNQINSQIDNSYMPGSPEYEQMRREMAAKDAAAGRNSQYGNRAVQLQAAIAKIKGDQRIQAMGGQNTLLNQGLQNENTGLSSLFGYLGQNSAQQRLQDLLSNNKNPININLPSSNL